MSRRSNPHAYHLARRRNAIRMVPALDADGNETREAKDIAESNAIRGTFEDDEIRSMPIHLVHGNVNHAVCGAERVFLDETEREELTTCPDCIAVRESSPRMPVKKALPREDDSAMDVTTTGRVVSR